MLLIDDDKSEVRKGEEHGRACAEGDYRLMARQDAPPQVNTLIVRKLAVINHEFVAEEAAKPVGQLCCKRNFGDEIQHLIALIERLLYQVGVYFGLAASCHTAQQHHIVFSEL